jgi:putative MATE family efflux protein
VKGVAAISGVPVFMAHNYRPFLMRDLTKGPIRGHLLQLSTFIMVSMIFQTLYLLVDLYFVGRLGKEAIAGVALAGNVTMVVLALTQALSVGATSLIAQALGRQDRAHAERVFNQAFVLAACVGAGFGVVGLATRHAYAGTLAADPATTAFGVQYMDLYIPAMALQFAIVAMGAALRGMGDMKIPMLIQVGTVLVNILLAPVLILGWGTGVAFGVRGAALATLVGVAAGLVAFVAYFRRASSPMRFRPAEWRPDVGLWKDILRIGLPAGGEFLLIATYIVLVYGIIRPFGAAAQAGFGIGARLMQSMFLPAVAIGFAAAPVAGQNYGARQGDRVRQTFYNAAGLSAAVMVGATLLCHLAPASMVAAFNADPAVVQFGVEYLQIISWNFLATGVIFVSSSVFQGLGNTIPALASSAIRIVLFALPALVLARQPGFAMRHVWYLSVASVFVQLCLNVWLLHGEFRRKLAPLEAPPPV